jgi:hypothetical protein
MDHFMHQNYGERQRPVRGRLSRRGREEVFERSRRGEEVGQARTGSGYGTANGLAREIGDAANDIRAGVDRYTRGEDVGDDHTSHAAGRLESMKQAGGVSTKKVLVKDNKVDKDNRALESGQEGIAHSRYVTYYFTNFPAYLSLFYLRKGFELCGF